MPDILIRDVPDDVVAAIDAKAQRAGLSRTEYLRRALSRERSEEREAPVDRPQQLVHEIRPHDMEGDADDVGRDAELELRGVLEDVPRRRGRVARHDERASRHTSPTGIRYGAGGQTATRTRVSPPRPLTTAAASCLAVVVLVYIFQLPATNF